MTQPTHPTNPIILALIVIMGLAIGYVYYSQVSADQTYDISLPVVARDTDYMKFKDMRFDFSLFQDQGFSALKMFGEFPMQLSGGGKRDIFSP